jgi:hypothetical protein
MANVIQGPSVSNEKFFAAKHDIWHVEVAVFHAAAKQQVTIKKLETTTTLQKQVLMHMTAATG